MNIESAEKKLREAKFFLNKMIEQERGAFGDKEQFGFYLSAFLSAATSVRGALSPDRPNARPRNPAGCNWMCFSHPAGGLAYDPEGSTKSTIS
jgi:hypothetical protein